MAIDPLIIKKLGGSKKVAAALDITPSALWRLTRPGAEVMPKRQRQLVDLARRAGLSLDYADFHRDLDPALSPGGPVSPAENETPAKQKAKSKAVQPAASAGCAPKTALARRASKRRRG